MTAYADPWDWLSTHIHHSNREVATRWHYVGSLPIVIALGAFAVWFDGERLRMRGRQREINYELAEAA